MSAPTALRLRDVELDKLKPLSIKQMDRLFHSDTVITRLIKLELTAYLDNTGQVLIGFDDGVPAEERWHYCTVPPGNGLWYRFDGPACQPSSNILSQVGDSLALGAELANWEWLVEDVRDFLFDTPMIGPSEVLTASRLIRSDRTEDLARVSYHLGLQGMHDLACHTEEWLAANDEIDSFPPHLAQRMYGLKALR
jgi:hypothetical protein